MDHLRCLRCKLLTPSWLTYGGSSISGPLLRQLPTAGLAGVIHAAAWFTSSRGFLVGRQVWPSNIVLSSVSAVFISDAPEANSRPQTLQLPTVFPLSSRVSPLIYLVSMSKAYAVPKGIAILRKFKLRHYRAKGVLASIRRL